MLRHILFILLATLLGLSATYGQLSGTKTIGGTSPNYANISLAVSALSSQGVNGPVVFNIAPGIYTGKISIGVITGVSATNTITFQSANGDSSSVIITDSSTISTSSNYTLRLQQTTRLHFKGLTIRRTGSADNAGVVEIGGTSNFLSFTSCRFEGQSSTSLDLAKTIVKSNTLNTNANLIFDRNVFLNGSYGLYLEGQGSGAGFLHTGNKVMGNHFLNQYHTAVRLAYQDAPEFVSNRISTNSTYHSYQGLWAFYCTNGTQVLRNRFEIVTGKALYFSNSSGSSIARSLVANNFVAHGGLAGNALLFENSHSSNIYFNSVNAYNVSSDVRLLQISGLSTSQLHIANNNLQSSGTGYVYYIDPNTNAAIAYCNYNNIKNNGSSFSFFKSNGAQSNLGAWQTATGFDQNSMAVNPSYVSNIDLHLLSDSLDKKGTNALMPPLVALDIDGNTRSTLIPDIGAHEIFLDDLSIGLVSVSDSSICEGELVTVTLGLVNRGNFIFNGDVELNYTIGSVISRSASYYGISLLPMDTLSKVIVLYDTLLQAGIYPVVAWNNVSEDINVMNDTMYSTHIHLHAYPLVNLGSDTLLCGHLTVPLDAGQGAMAYLWSTGDTLQSIVVDTNMIGYGANWVKVVAANNGCATSDSVMITFVNCTSVEENRDNIFSVLLAPNPLQESSVIYISHAASSAVVIEVLDLTGRILMRETTTEMIYPIGLKLQSAGLYYIRVTDSEQSRIIKSVLR